MILGYEQPVELPTMSVYDKEMAKMYITLLKDDYDKAMLELKEFYDKYNDFWSPSDKDNQNWYNNTIGKIDAFLQQYPDANRSREGRARIANVIKSIPTLLLSLMRATAEIGKKYNESVADLQSKGLYNEDFQNFINKGANLKDWDSSKGVWNIPAATAFRDINQYTQHWFDNLLDTDKGKYGQFGRKMGVDEQDLRKIVQENLPQIKDTDWGRYMINKYKTEQDLENAIVQSNLERTREKIEIDQIAKAEYDAKMQQQELNLKRQQLALQRQKQAAEAILNANKNNSTYSVNYDLYTQSMNALTGGKHNSFSEGYDTWFIHNANAVVQNWIAARKKRGEKITSNLKQRLFNSYVQQTYNKPGSLNKYYKQLVKNKTLDELLVQAPTQHMNNILSRFSTDDDGYIILGNETKVYSRSQMDRMAHGNGVSPKGGKHYNGSSIGRLRPTNDNRVLYMPNKQKNIMRFIEVKDENNGLWYIADSEYNPNLAKFTAEDQVFLNNTKQGVKAIETPYIYNK